jgi:hypothetical protein
MGIFDIFSNSDANNAANAQIQAYQQGLAQLTANIGQGNNALTTNYNAALQPAQNNVTQGNAGVNQLLTMLGLGPGGPQDITSQFTNTPGYNFTLDQGAQNVQRQQQAAGQGPVSGQTLLALQNQGQGTAQQYYQNYLQQLQPFLGYNTSATGQVGNLYSGLGQGLNTNYNTIGNAAYGASVGQGNAQAQADYANLQSSANIWNLIGNLAKGGAGAVGGGLGSALGPGGAATQLFGAFNPSNYAGIGR